MTAVAVETRDAATVMLVRDSPASDGIEVFMLQRNLRSEFAGGAFVFPGGAVDADDHHDDVGSICAGRTDAEASSQLGIASGGLAFWVAAIRESFEEAGLLLAYGADRQLVRLDDQGTAARFDEHRRTLGGSGQSFAEMCHLEGLRLATDTMHYFSHWITPEGAPRRYDTRFFVARAPDGQPPRHDNHEVVANLWIRPADALARHRAGDFELIFPTVRSLVALAQFACADDLLAHAARVPHLPAVEPRIVADHGGGLRIVLPYDPEYVAAEPALAPRTENKLPASNRAKHESLIEDLSTHEGGR